MPGLFGTINLTQLTRGFERLEINPQNAKLIDKTTRTLFNIQPTETSRKSANFEENKVSVFYEGIILNNLATSEKIAQSLHQKYVNEGELFARNLRGSFQIFVVDSRGSHTKFFLYSDHIASRQIFYSTTKDFLFFSPDIESFINNIPIRTADKMSMVHFMAVGHFPSGKTAINEISVLGPGEYLAIQSESIQKRRFFNFEIEPYEPMDIHDASSTLDNVLEKRILDYWQHAETPAILLSGGYDSQYIFYTIANAVENTSILRTVTWGQDPEKQNADMAIARRTAKRFNTRHIEIVKTLDCWNQEYDEMFTAQNGMTASSFYHAHEFTVCKTLRNVYGVKSVLRGDECLGYGPESRTVQNALLTNSMSLPENIPGFTDWFTSGDKILAQYHDFMNDFIHQYKNNSFDCLKDILDFYERQNMNRNPQNYFKLHNLEVFSPLLDPEVLNLTSKFPSRFRTNKNLFKRIVRAKFGKELRIADYTNLTDWRMVIDESNELKSFFRSELAKLPSFFKSDYFINLINILGTRNNKYSIGYIKNLLKPLIRILPLDIIRQVIITHRFYANQCLNIPAHMLIIRAVVLSRWNDWWISH